MLSFDDLKKDARRQLENDKKREKTSTTSWESLKQSARQQNTIGIDQNYISSFFTDAQNYLRGASESYNGMGYANRESVFASQKQQADDLRSRSGKVRAYLNGNKASMKEEDYNSLIAMLDDFDNSSASIYDAFSKKNEGISQFASEYAYTEFLRQNELEGMTADEIQAARGSRVSDEDKGIIHELMLSNMPYSREYAQQDGVDMALYDDVERKRKYIGDKYGVDLSEDIYNNGKILTDLLNDDVIAYTTMDGRNVTWDSLLQNAQQSEDLANRLSTYSVNADWAEKSKKIQTVADTESDYSIVYEVLQSLVPYDWATAEASGIDRETFDAIERKRRYISEKYGVDLYSDIYSNFDTLSNILAQLDGQDGEKETFENISYLTSEEKAVLSYIYETEGRAAALAWHNSRMNLYDERFRGGVVAGFKGIGKDSPFWGSVGSVALSLGSGIEYLGDIFDYMATGELDRNTMALASSSIRSGVMENTNWEIGNWDAFDFIYGTGMSGVDSLVASTMGGNVGGAFLGLSAAAQATNDALDKGMSNGQAFLSGAASGVFEGLFEKWSIGNFNALKAVASANGRDIAKNIAKSMLTNASEETLTEAANIVYDLIINGDFSQYETLVRQYVVSGMTESEAKKKAAVELGLQIAEAGASGALMGLGFGAAGSGRAIAHNVASSAQSAQQTYNIGKQIRDAEGGIDALSSLAAEVAGADSKLSGRAKNLNGDVATGTGLGKVVAGAKNMGRNWKAGQVYRGVEFSVTAQTKTDVAAALQEAGLSKRSANHLADAVVANMNGKQLTNFQRSTLDLYEGNEKVKETISKVLNDPDASVNQRNQKVSRFASDIAVRKATGATNMSQGSAKKSTSAEEVADESIHEAAAEGKATLKATGETITIKAISSLESGNVLLELENGDTVDAKDVEFGYSGDALVYETVANIGISVTDANEIISAYKSGNVAGDVYAKGIKDAYNYGVFGYRLDDLAKGTHTSKLTAAQRTKAFKLGRAKAGNTKSNDPARKKSANRKRGVVKGYGVTIKELNKSFNTTQRSAYRILDTIAQITGVDIVLYRSTSDADGNLRGGMVDGIDMSKAHGAFSWHNDKIYIDINAGVLKQAEMADAAKYSMLRTFGHEFTHFLEKHNPVEYGNFQDLVFDVMRRNGQNPDAMIEAYMEQDSGLTRDKASREVVAEAMTDILPETSFVQELAQKHQNIFQMLLEKLKEFVAELNEHFRSLGINRSAEAAAVKEHINGTLQYAEEIVQMFDRVAVQAVERYQTAQTAEKSTVAKSNGVQLEIKQIGDSGQFYVQADRQVLTGNDPDVWGKQIERYINDVIRQQQDITIPTSDGHILLLTGRSSYKLSDRHISMIANKVAGFLADEEFALKGRAATHIDELIQVARFDKYKADKDGKHQNDIGEDGFNNFVAHFRDFDGKYYRIPFTAGINADEETAYSIGKIRQRSFPANRGSSPKLGRSKGGRKASGDIIYSSADQSQVKTAVQIAFENAQRKANDKKTQKQTRIPGDNGEVVDARQEVSYSLRRDAQLMDKAVSRNKAFGFVQNSDLQKAKADRETVKAEMERLGTESAVSLPADIEGNTFVSNSSYGGTEENTTVCPRSLAAEALVDAVSEYIGRPLTVQEQLDISQDLQGRTLTPECLYCYVATDRKAYRAFLGDYVQQRDAVIAAYRSGNTDVARYSKKYRDFLRGRSSTDALLKDFASLYRDVDQQVYGALYGQFLDGRKDTDNMWKRFNLWIDTYKSGKPMVQASHLANISKLMGDIQNEFGSDLKAQIKDAMAYAQSASWAKKRVGYLAYNGHILNWKQQRIDRLNSHYGLRMYSFSDFSPAFILENMQMITDASVRGLKMLSYSKELDFVRIFASTGMNINVSAFGFERNGGVYENNIIGADWAQAQKLRSKYPNVGITFVATNDTLVNWALDQDWIDVVIPYHLVRTGAEIARALEYTNYTGESADKKATDWTKGIDEASISPQMHNNDKDMYLAALGRNHLRPRFVRWLSHPNYMKLVNETRQNATESRPVRPVFDLSAAMDSLAKLAVDGYYKPIGGTVDRMYEIAAEIGEKIEHGNAGDASLQRRTSTLSNRDLLAEATGTNEYERSKLKEYQEKLDNSRAQAKALAGLEKELGQLRAANDPKSRKRIGFLQDEIIKTKNRISVLNGVLSRMEAKDLAGVVGREKNRILERLQTEYGTIPQGENPVRADTLPKSTDGSNKVSYTARTVKGAKATPDAFADLIDAEVAKGNLTYIPITNDATTQKAVRYIQDEGWEAAKGSWSANVRAGKSGAEMAAVGALLLNNAARAGDKAAWLDILHDYQILGTNTAQGLQALRILKKLQPEDSLYMIRRSIRQMVEDMHLDTEVTLDPQLEAKYQNAKTDLERDAALKEITKNVADQIPSTALDKWTALRYVNMLGNLRTQIRNLTGNLGMKAVTSIKDSIATGLEQIVYLASGGKLQRTKAVIADKDLLKAAKGDFETVEAVILGGGKYSDAMEETTAFARAVQEQRTIFKLKPLEGYRKLTNWAMERGDLVFSKSAYAGALAKYLKAHGIKESDLSKVDPVLMDEARLYAVKEAQEATFRDTNVLSGWISKVGRRKDTPEAVKVISEGIMPFRKTPANVLVRAEEYSPLGVINSLVISIQKMRKDSDVTGAQVINSWAKTLTGTALFCLGMLLQNLGLLTGAGDDDEDKDQFESLNGWQNYAIVLPDGTNLTIDFLSPAAMPMFMGAQMMGLMHDGGVEAKEIERALLSIADPMIQMSMLQGVNDTLENIQYSEDTLGQFLINACTSYLTQGLTNTLLGQMERSFESSRNSTYVDQDSALPNWMQRQLGKASAKIPGWDFNQIPYINAWGEEEQYAGVPANMAYNLLSPSYVDKGAEDTVSLELVRLNDIQSDVNVFPQTPDKTISYEDKNGVVHDDYNLSAEEYVALARKQGQTQRKIVEKMLASKLYDSLPDQYKAKAVGFAYSYAREYAQIDVLDRSGFSSGWMAEIQDDAAEGILNYVVKENIKGMLLAGDISANEAVDRRIRYFGDSRDEATQKVAYWNFQAAHPNYAGLPESAVMKYYDYAEPANISLEIYNAYYSRAKGLTKKADIENVIHSLNLTKAQKDALYRSNENWSEKKLSEAIWHRQ